MRREGKVKFATVPTEGCMTEKSIVLRSAIRDIFFALSMAT